MTSSASYRPRFFEGKSIVDIFGEIMFQTIKQMCPLIGFFIISFKSNLFNNIIGYLKPVIVIELIQSEPKALEKYMLRANLVSEEN